MFPACKLWVSRPPSSRKRDFGAAGKARKDRREEKGKIGLLPFVPAHPRESTNQFCRVEILEINMSGVLRERLIAFVEHCKNPLITDS